MFTSSNFCILALFHAVGKEATYLLTCTGQKDGQILQSCEI